MTLNQMIDRYGLDKINSATKYPSILTYHELGKKGGMTNELCEGKEFPADDWVEITEKVDGTNSRLILTGGDYLIGSREEIVYAKGDRIKNSMIIDPVIQGLSNVLALTKTINDDILVIFGETYGHKIQQGSKVYCVNSQKRNYRVFDIIHWTAEEFNKIMTDIPKESLSTWRDNGNQAFLDTDDLSEFCREYLVARTPIITQCRGRDIPTIAEATLSWMEDIIPVSKATLDSPDEAIDLNQAFGRSEGLVIRTLDRSFIRKLRFEDYNKGKKMGWK